MHSPQELEVRVRMWELLGPELVKYDLHSAKDVNLMLETCKVFLSDFIKAYKDGEISFFQFMVDRAKYQGEVMIWANSGDQDFGVERAKLLKQAYPHSELVIFNENAHHTEKITEHQEKLLKSFFDNGLYSQETRQLLK